MILRKLDPAEHGNTRQLWEEVFREDTKAFLDYYYYIKARENQIFVVEEDDGLCSMLQLNPYRVRIGEKEFPSAYIIAVATREPYRGRGYMGALLRRSLDEMYRAKAPFTFLMPAAEAIYTPYDFRFIYSQNIGMLENTGSGIRWVTGPGEKGPEGGLAFSDAGIWDAEELADFYKRYFDGCHQVCTVRDETYYRTMILEQQSERGGVRMIREGGVLKGYYAYADEDGPEIREPLYLRGYGEGFLRSVRELAGGKAEKIRVHACPAEHAGEKKPLIMARIVCLESFLSALTVPEDVELNCSFAVIDPILTQNSRVWRLESPAGETEVRTRETEDSEGVLPVAELTELLFGRISPEEAGAREGVILSERLREELGKITGLDRTWFNEIV